MRPGVQETKAAGAWSPGVGFPSTAHSLSPGLHTEEVLRGAAVSAGRVRGSCWVYIVQGFLTCSVLPGELNSRLNSDTKLMSSWLPLNANVLLRSLVKVVGLYSFMLNLSPRLTLLSLFEVPLTIAAEKVYNGRHQVCVAVREEPVLEVSSQPSGQQFWQLHKFHDPWDCMRVRGGGGAGRGGGEREGWREGTFF